jgi:hypothetical protein
VISSLKKYAACTAASKEWIPGTPMPMIRPTAGGSTSTTVDAM